MWVPSEKENVVRTFSQNENIFRFRTIFGSIKDLLRMNGSCHGRILPRKCHANNKILSLRVFLRMKPFSPIFNLSSGFKIGLLLGHDDSNSLVYVLFAIDRSLLG